MTDEARLQVFVTCVAPSAVALILFFISYGATKKFALNSYHQVFYRCLFFYVLVFPVLIVFLDYYFKRQEGPTLLEFMALTIPMSILLILGGLVEGTSRR